MDGGLMAVDGGVYGRIDVLSANSPYPLLVCTVCGKRAVSRLTAVSLGSVVLTSSRTRLTVKSGPVKRRRAAIPRPPHEECM
jgi:hypothetical protein